MKEATRQQLREQLDAVEKETRSKLLEIDSFNTQLKVHKTCTHTCLDQFSPRTDKSLQYYTEQSLGTCITFIVGYFLYRILTRDILHKFTGSDSNSAFILEGDELQMSSCFVFRRYLGLRTVNMNFWTF